MENISESDTTAADKITLAALLLGNTADRFAPGDVRDVLDDHLDDDASRPARKTVINRLRGLSRVGVLEEHRVGSTQTLQYSLRDHFRADWSDGE